MTSLPSQAGARGLSRSLASVFLQGISATAQMKRRNQCSFALRESCSSVWIHHKQLNSAPMYPSLSNSDGLPILEDFEERKKMKRRKHPCTVFLKVQSKLTLLALIRTHEHIVDIWHPGAHCVLASCCCALVQPMDHSPQVWWQLITFSPCTCDFCICSSPPYPETHNQKGKQPL